MYKNRYETSDGEKITQGTIRKRLTDCYRGMMEKYICEGCGYSAHDRDHTISQQRCKQLHKTELIYSEANIVYSCRKTHQEWESFHDGKFSHHKNAYNRMLFVAMHDPETFKKRFQSITNPELKKRLQDLYDNIDDSVRF